MEYKSLSEFFNLLYINKVQYVVLRKFENLPFGFIDNDHDLDILCNDKKTFVSLTGAVKRNIGVSAYKVFIENSWVDIDIRFVGDSYYDVNWEIEILKKRVLNSDGIYIMDSVNMYYATIYHCLIQKKEIPSYYKSVLYRFRNSFNNNCANNMNLDYFTELEYYMRLMKFNFVFPIDESVFLNKLYLDRLLIENQLPFIQRVIFKLYTSTPYQIKKIIPPILKQYLFSLV